MSQQVDPIDLVAGQIACSEPKALTSLLNLAAESLPACLFREPQTGIGLLTQNIEPRLAVQLSQDWDRAKFTVAHQENGRSSRDQSAHIGQQGQLFASTAVSSDILDPGPGDGDRPFAVGQTNDQQLMSETDLGAVHNQADFTQMMKLRCWPLQMLRWSALSW